VDFWRQLDIISPQQLQHPITVIGCGGIGSPTILALAKMGCGDITAYDPDRVEQHNLPNQLFRLEDLGRPKTDALADTISSFTGTKIKAMPEEVTGQKLKGLVVSAVDSMTARKAIWQNCLRFNPDTSLYIDGRMSGEVCRIFSINPLDPDHVRFYEQTLYSDEEAWEDPCTSRAVIYNVFMAASLIAHQVKMFFAHEPVQRELAFDFKTLTFIYSR
jgi:molybdopterin/thiamine biosynthesis adenylyltransferase